MASLAGSDEASQSVLVKQPELRQELLRRAREDQAAREAVAKWMQRVHQNGDVGESTFESPLNPSQKAEFKKLSEKLERTDKDNTSRLGQIVERYGWPTSSLVGKDGAQSAWLLVQHADADPRF